MSTPPPIPPSSVFSSSSMPAPQPQQTWLQRHWKGLVIAILGLIVVSVVAMILSIVGLVMWSMKQSDVYKQAMAKTRQNAEVAARLGTPIEPGWIISGHINLENDAGTAEMTIPIHGPQQEAKIYLDARKRMGEWTFNYLTVKTAAGEQIEVVAQKPD